MTDEDWLALRIAGRRSLHMAMNPMSRRAMPGTANFQGNVSGAGADACC